MIIHNGDDWAKRFEEICEQWTKVNHHLAGISCSFDDWEHVDIIFEKLEATAFFVYIYNCVIEDQEAFAGKETTTLKAWGYCQIYLNDFIAYCEKLQFQDKICQQFQLQLLEYLHALRDFFSGIFQ